MRRPLVTIVALSAATLLLAGAAQARPSWCPGNRNAAERVICADEELGSLDDVLNVAYKRARFDSPDEAAEIKREQRRWLGRRNLCGSDWGCLQRRYLEQIQYLESYFAN